MNISDRDVKQSEACCCGGDDVLDKEKTTKQKGNKIKSFLNSTSNFRFVFMAVMMFDVRYLWGMAYYIVLAIMFVWALCLMVDRLIINKGIFRLRYRTIIYIFLAFGLITIILHGERNFIANAFTLYWISVCLFMFYGMHSEFSNIRIKKEMKRLFDFINAITTFIMLVSLVLFAIFPNGFKLMGFEFCIIEKRFVGVIPNANVTAFYSVIAIVLCTFLLRMRKADRTLSLKLRIWYIFCIIVNSLTLILTDSNASLLFMMVYISFMFFYELFKEFTLKKLHTILFRITATVLSCVMVVSSMFFMRVGVQNGVAFMMNKRSVDIAVSTTLDANNGDIDLEDESTRSSSEARPAFGHQNKNIDSGRYVLWRQALGLIEIYPFFGIGKDNIKDYGNEYLGGLRYTSLAGYKYVDFHNGLLTLTVSFGIVGLSLFLVFAVTIAKAVLKSIFRFKERSRRDGNVLVLIAAFSAAYCVYSMFEVALFVDYTYRVFIFWLIIGLAMSYVFKYRRQASHSSEDETPIHDDTSELNYLRKKLGFFKKRKYAADGK